MREGGREGLLYYRILTSEHSTSCPVYRNREISLLSFIVMFSIVVVGVGIEATPTHQAVPPAVARPHPLQRSSLPYYQIFVY